MSLDYSHEHHCKVFFFFLKTLSEILPVSSFNKATLGIMSKASQNSMLGIMFINFFLLVNDIKKLFLCTLEK